MARKVFVTGASRGLGRAIAVEFAREGYDVAVNARSVERLRETAEAIKKLGGEPLLLAGDVSIESDVAEMFRAIKESFNGLDVLVNNAGIQNRYRLEEMPLEEWSKVIGVNLRGPFLCSKYAVKLMEGRENPSIINITSVHETLPKPYYVHYSASKGGLGMMTRTLALELAGRGIRVNAIAPGAMVTEMNREVLEDREKMRRLEAAIPLGRLGMPEEVAYAAVFLASDKARYITGATLYIDGGLRLCSQLLLGED